MLAHLRCLSHYLYTNNIMPVNSFYKVSRESGELITERSEPSFNLKHSVLPKESQLVSSKYMNSFTDKSLINQKSLFECSNKNHLKSSSEMNPKHKTEFIQKE